MGYFSSSRTQILQLLHQKEAFQFGVPPLFKRKLIVYLRESVGFSLGATVFLARHDLFFSLSLFSEINVGQIDKSSGSIIAYIRSCSG
jgi:hypothetical protein